MFKFSKSLFFCRFYTLYKAPSLWQQCPVFGCSTSSSPFLFWLASKTRQKRSNEFKNFIQIKKTSKSGERKPQAGFQIFLEFISEFYLGSISGILKLLISEIHQTNDFYQPRWFASTKLKILGIQPNNIEIIGLVKIMNQSASSWKPS